MIKSVLNLSRNSNGIMSIEFVVAIPLFLVLFFGMFEYSRVIYHTQKATKVTGTLADMISMFKPVDTSKTIVELRADCVNQPLMITRNRINAILSDPVVEALLLPIGTDKVVIHISSVYKAAGRPPRVEWKYRYQKNASLVFPSAIGAVNANANMRTIGGRVGGMFDGENYIVVEAAIKYDSVIAGIADAFAPAFTDGMIYSTIIYPIRNYTYDVNGLPQYGLNYIWPDKLPSPPFAAVSTNPSGC